MMLYIYINDGSFNIQVMLAIKYGTFLVAIPFILLKIIKHLEKTDQFNNLQFFVGKVNKLILL